MSGTNSSSAKSCDPPETEPRLRVVGVPANRLLQLAGGVADAALRDVRLRPKQSAIRSIGIDPLFPALAGQSEDQDQGRRHKSVPGHRQHRRVR